MTRDAARSPTVPDDASPCALRDFSGAYAFAGSRWAQTLAGARELLTVLAAHPLAMPTLVVAGDDDTIVPMVNARVLASLLPRARLEVVRGAGHWLVLERGPEIARLVGEFLDARAPITPEDRNKPL